jgi:hypothetical protein
VLYAECGYHDELQSIGEGQNGTYGENILNGPGPIGNTANHKRYKVPTPFKQENGSPQHDDSGDNQYDGTQRGEEFHDAEGWRKVVRRIQHQANSRLCIRVYSLSYDIDRLVLGFMIRTNLYLCEQAHADKLRAEKHQHEGSEDPKRTFDELGRKLRTEA